uniref:Protein kinase domain-containing protein n=1 Tax=Panagrolaimus sp. JU765 TaxID=591449 RepID=A0AC34RJA1_9BILA
MNFKVFQHLEKDLFNTGPKSLGTFPREKSSSTLEDDKIVDKMNPLQCVIANEQFRPQQAPTEIINVTEEISNEGNGCDNAIPPPDIRSQTPTTNRPLIEKPSTSETPTRQKRKRKIGTGTPNIKEAYKKTYVNGDSSSNDISIPHSPSPQPSTVAIISNHVCSSDSNLSPPRLNQNANGFKDSESQTDPINFDAIAQAAAVKNEFMEENKNLRWEISELNKNFDRTKLTLLSTREFLKNLLIEHTKRERNDARKALMRNNLRIGTFHNSLIDGSAAKELNRRKAELDSMKEELVLETANLKKKRGTKEARRVAEVAASSSKDEKDVFVKPELPQFLTQEQLDRRDELLRMRKEIIKKEDIDICAERERLDRDKNAHIRESKRIQYEEASRFKDYGLLNSKYLPITLLGKGGFSEVWRAFDLEECRQTACKIHRVHEEWDDRKKANYVRHAIREKDIHKNLDHPNIVKLYEIFKIDDGTFCSVLEYCDGNDLDFYLKQHRTLPEKETRLIIGQVVDALRYLNEFKTPIIHYDLKPANILLQSGIRRFEIKITDFGLSKTVVNAEGNDDIELTSQGAGTYWYLPPETFKTGPGGAPRISSKVDVWSVGVICYQCIYGKKPFGDDQTQKTILNEGTILKATMVNFPPKPTVSQLAQDFIRKCLQYEPANRADVLELARHEYVKPFTRRNLQQPATLRIFVILLYWSWQIFHSSFYSRILLYSMICFEPSFFMITLVWVPDEVQFMVVTIPKSHFLIINFLWQLSL